MATKKTAKNAAAKKPAEPTADVKKMIAKNDAAADSLKKKDVAIEIATIDSAQTVSVTVRGNAADVCYTENGKRVHTSVGLRGKKKLKVNITAV